MSDNPHTKNTRGDRLMTHFDCSLQHCRISVKCRQTTATALFIGFLDVVGLHMYHITMYNTVVIAIALHNSISMVSYGYSYNIMYYNILFKQNRLYVYIIQYMAK